MPMASVPTRARGSPGCTGPARAVAVRVGTVAVHVSASWAPGDLRRGPRDRHLTREHVCQRYVLAGQVTCSAVTRRSRGLSDDLAGWRRHDMRDSVPPCGRLAGASAGPEPPPTTSPSIPPRPAPSITPLVLPRRKKVAGAYFWGCLAGSDLRLMASFRRFSGGRARAGTLKVCAGHLLAPPEPQQ